jgi:MFS family permease
MSTEGTLLASQPLTRTGEPDVPAIPGARHALVLLILINLFNYIDRQVLAAVEPEIARTFFPAETGPHPNEGKLMGLLSTAFLLTYMLTAPLFGWLANRMSRWVLIGIGVITWSIASGGSGLAGAYFALLLTRCLVGIGEAVYGPVAPVVISDLFPVKKRGQALSWFYAAIPFGGALGYVLGDAIVRLDGNNPNAWRHAFYAVVPPGILLGLWCFLMREPTRGQAGRRERWSDYLILLKTPSYVLNTLGMTAMTFAMGGMAFWAPRYLLFRNAEPLFGIPPKMAFGAITVVAGLAATLLGGIAGDKLRGRYPGSYFLVSGAAMLLAFPLVLLMITLDFPLAWLPLALFVFCLFFNTGPTNTILANVTHPLLRAPGFALNILVIHLFGDAISPPVMGAVKDASDLNAAFYLVSITVLIGGLFWLWGARHLQRDTELAPTRLPG